MFQWAKKKIIKSVAKEIPSRLVIKYGKKDHYLPEEIDWALRAVGRFNDTKYTNYAYGMLTDHSYYMSLGLLSSFGSYESFHKEVGRTLFKQECVPNISLYLEYSSIHSSTTKPISFDALSHLEGSDTSIDIGSDPGGTSA